MNKIKFISIKKKLPKHKQRVLIKLNNCNCFDDNDKPELIQIGNFYDKKIEYDNIITEEKFWDYDKKKKTPYFSHQKIWKDFEHFISMNGPRFNFKAQQNYTIQEETNRDDYVIGWLPLEILE